MLVLPPRALSVSAGADIASPLRGVVHVHTRRSDGSGTMDQIASAAARAGLQFVVFTDHGDGTRTPEPPSYRAGVLCIDAFEVTTFGGHLVALGLWNPAPYPIGGEPRDVVADVARLGGMSIAAHPVSEKPALAWTGWDAPIDGMEWLNADSEWRNEPIVSLARALITYPWRQSETLARLLDRPVDALTRWDHLTAGRRVVTLSAPDAHANLGFTSNEEARSSLTVPGYEQIFRTFSIGLPSARLTGDAVSDAHTVIEEIRAGHLYSSIDALAAPARVSFTASSGTSQAQGGDAIAAGTRVSFSARTTAPPGSRILLLANGKTVSSREGATLEYDGAAVPGAYRVEVHLPGESGGAPPVPWILTNPIYVTAPTHVPAPAGSPSPGPGRTKVAYADGPLAPLQWGIEKNAQSFGEYAVVPDAVHGTRILFRYALSGMMSEEAWIALGMRTDPDLPRYSGLRFKARADRPTRLWVQLWVPVPTGNLYWRRSVLVSDVAGPISVAFDDMKPTTGAAAPPPLDAVRSVQLLVDRTNTRLGQSGQIWIDDIEYVGGR